MPGAAAPADAATEARCVDIDRLATSTASSSRSTSVVKRATSSAAAMVLPGGSRPEVDMKKRPLSIRSTSSNTSTVSATQRRRRKKQAVGDGVVVSGARPDVDLGDLPTLTERLTQQAASYSDELNSLTSSLLEHSESESSGGGGGVVRLSSLLTDEDELDVDVSPSSDCGDAGHLVHSTSPSRSESYVDMVVAEILSTERAYVSDLRDVIQVRRIIRLCPAFNCWGSGLRDISRTWLRATEANLKAVNGEEPFFCSVKVAVRGDLQQTQPRPKRVLSGKEKMSFWD